VNKSDPIPAEVTRLQRRILDEIAFAFGVRRNGWMRQLFGWLFILPARHFARIVAKYQAMVPGLGFGETARSALPDFNTVVRMKGEGNIPAAGPLVVASNHIGGVDTLAVASCILRRDLKIMVSDVGFLRSMSIADDYFIFVPGDAAGRMAALQQALDHLKLGGAVLVFAHGEVEPDPSLFPEKAEAALSEWSPSLEIMLRKVPETRLVIGIMSGAIHPAAMRNPLVRLRRTEPARQKLAEFLQIMQQMILPQSRITRMNVSLTKPLAMAELGRDHLMPAVIDQARALLREHLDWIK